MNVNRIMTTIALAGGLALATAGAMAQDTAHVPLQKTIGQTTPTGPIPSLAVINSQGATLYGGKLVLTGVSKNSIVFADRPVRAAGHVTTEQFIMQWDEGKDNFAIDPPNATVSVLGGVGSDVSDAVVTLKAPKLEGTTLTFDVAILEGDLAGATGPAALFIDHFGGGFGGGGFHGGGFQGGYAHVGNATFAHVGGYHGGAYWHAPVYHGAWYGGGAVAAGVVAGAAIGAAAAAPYAYRPYCGYYPYPPCY
ncbi:hypothetical protein [Mesorhizobium ventifaucium]|uniref:DUF5666 domain-containing protein n=1 Tax=Mesorhizobium ventifaucium TaxID=666020 RepID=A0ABN8JY34_9HYPH|nr:hypothetical protein [Mesorhizobium ventifaucium]CAH2402094.1 conserved exported hypothetical protein [Mesorhizobium ventifaucium]